MNIYLSIMVTVLVLTQIIRITQNAIQLHRHKKLFEAELHQVKDLNITEADFNMQRKAYRLIVEHFERDEE